MPAASAFLETVHRCRRPETIFVVPAGIFGRSPFKENGHDDNVSGKDGPHG